ncbi:MAG TPA: hypothetical protein DHV25_02160 [Candidatus Kerfeldbacteria bacterium]|nr:MAG: Type II secretion system protein [Parcubacteria group bacterium GW2011_GWC2_49_9]HCJ52506.1 hypothetical protein [Candidatus Kerfeldbacteria bacterium]
MKFRFVASTREGRIIKGTRYAENKQDLGRNMNTEGLLLMSAEPESFTLKERMTAINVGGISVIDKVLFARHLAIMIKSGIPLIESLQITVEQTSNESLKIILGQILENVRNGKSLANSLEQHRRTFGGLFVSMVRVGESSGTLDANLDYLSIQLEKDYELRQKVRTAMLYPGIILAATVLLGGALSIFVLPKLVDLFYGLNVELPIFTKIFLAMASFLASWAVWIIVLLVMAVIGMRVFARLAPVKKFLDMLVLKAPLLRQLILKITITRFTRTLGTLLRSGLPIVESLAITQDTLNNQVYEDIIVKVRGNIEKGTLLGTSLAEHEKYFPKVVSRMIGVGERTGKLGETLGYLTDFYENEVDATTKNLTTVIEPILLIVIGLIVGGLGVAIIAPIYQLSGSIGR